MEYKIINIKTPEVGPQPVSKSVWNDLQALKDMGYMRYEQPEIVMPETVEPEPVYVPSSIPVMPEPVTTGNDPQLDDADPFGFDVNNIPAKRKYTKKTITDGA